MEGSSDGGKETMRSTAELGRTNLLWRTSAWETTCKVKAQVYEKTGWGESVSTFFLWTMPLRKVEISILTSVL